MRKINLLKNLLLYLAPFFSGQVLTSQTLTCQNNCPQPGQMFSIRTSSPVFSSSGTNQLWNFSQVPAISAGTQMVSYVALGAVPAASLYPQANVVKVENGYNSFLHTGSNGVRLAVANTSSYNIEPMQLPLPFSYGNTYTQTTLWTVVNGNDTIIHKEVSTFNAHGTGTLILPSGTFNDVLSIKGTKTKSSTLNGAPYDYIYYDNFNYYYSDKIAHPCSILLKNRKPDLQIMGLILPLLRAFSQELKTSNYQKKHRSCFIQIPRTQLLELNCLNSLPEKLFSQMLQELN